MIVLASSYPLSHRESLSFTSKLCEKPLDFHTVVSGFVIFFLFSCRKILKRRNPVPHSAFQNHFKCTLLGRDSCFSLLRKIKKREKESFCSFFFHPTDSLLKSTCVSTSDQGFTAVRQHLSYHQQPPSLTLQPFPSTWKGSRAEGITSVSFCSIWGQIPG